MKAVTAALLLALLVAGVNADLPPGALARDLGPGGGVARSAPHFLRECHAPSAPPPSRSRPPRSPGTRAAPLGACA